MVSARDLGSKRGGSRNGAQRNGGGQARNGTTNRRRGPDVSPEKRGRLERVASRVRAIARRVAPKVKKAAKKTAQGVLELGERVTRPEPRIRMMHGRPHIAAAGLPTRREAQAVAQQARTELGTNCRMNQVKGPNGKEWIIWVCDPEDSKRTAQQPSMQEAAFGGGGTEPDRVFSKRTLASIDEAREQGIFGVNPDIFNTRSGGSKRKKKDSVFGVPDDFFE